MKTFTTLVGTVIGLTLAMLAWQSAHAENRTWTQASSGRTIEGEFVKVEGDNVHIRRAGGGIIPVPIKVLSKGDQEFIAAQAKATAPDGSTPTEEGEAKPTTVTLHDLHLCCSACGRKVEEAVADMEGIKVDVDRKEGIVTMEAPSQKAAQDAIHAIAAVGFYGKSDSHDVDFKSKGASAENVKMATVTGVHLCCKGCVTAAEKAIMAAEGVEEHTASSKAESFEITGDFSPSEVLRNLRRAGMNGVISTGAAPKAAE